MKNKVSSVPLSDIDMIGDICYYCMIWLASSLVSN